MTANNTAIKEVELQDPQAVVEGFLDACSALDFDLGMTFIDEHCVYKNMPFHTARGKARIKRDLTSMQKSMNLFEVEMVNIAASGKTVLTERVDTIAGRFFRVEIPLMGVFVVENGKITEWRDYFDWTSVFGKMGRSVIRNPFKS